MTRDESLTEKYNRLKSQAEGSVESLSEDDRGIMNEIRMIGGGLVMVLIVVLVLTEVYNSVDFATGPNGEYTGPFGSVVTTLETTGTAALTLLVVGFLVVAAGAIMRYFGGSFGGR